MDMILVLIARRHRTRLTIDVSDPRAAAQPRRLAEDAPGATPGDP